MNNANKKPSDALSRYANTIVNKDNCFDVNGFTRSTDRFTSADDIFLQREGESRLRRSRSLIVRRRRVDDTLSNYPPPPDRNTEVSHHGSHVATSRPVENVRYESVPSQPPFVFRRCNSFRRQSNSHIRSDVAAPAVNYPSHNNMEFCVSDILRDNMNRLTPSNAASESRYSNTMTGSSIHREISDTSVVPRRYSTSQFPSLRNVPEDASPAFYNHHDIPRNLSMTPEEHIFYTDRDLSPADMMHTIAPRGDTSDTTERRNTAMGENVGLRRMTYAARFKEELKQSQRLMFESIGRELKPRRFSRQEHEELNQSGSYVDLTSNPLQRRLPLGYGNTSETNSQYTGVETESRATRVRRHLQRSQSEVVLQNSVHQNFMESVQRKHSTPLFQSEIGTQIRSTQSDLFSATDSSHWDGPRNSQQTRHVYNDDILQTKKKPAFQISMAENLRGSQESISVKAQSCDNITERLQVGRIKTTNPAGHRKLILDEQILEDLFLRCGICEEMYNNGDKIPKVLPCHHTFCEGCLIDIHKGELDHRKNITGTFRSMPSAVRVACPSCRDAVIFTKDELKNLPCDRTVRALLDVVVHSDTCVIIYCSKHPTQSLSFFCETCVLPVCCDCTVLEHNQQSGHVVLNIDEALKTHSPVIESTIDSIDNQCLELVNQKTAVQHATDSLNNNKSDLICKLKETFNHFRTAANDRQEELTEIMQNDIRSKRNALEEQLKIIKRRRSELSAAKLRLVNSQEEKNIEDIMNNMSILENELENPNPSYNDCSETIQTIMFDTKEQMEVLRKLDGFSDVTFTEHHVMTELI